MKPYGLKRYEYGDLDVAGIKAFGRKSSAGNLPGKGGDIRAGQKSKSKRQTRCIIKGRARRQPLEIN